MRFAFACLLSFTLLAALVAAGALDGLDQWGVDHLMPGGRFTGEASLVDALVPLAGTHWDSAWSVVVNVVTVPASFVVALAIALWRSRALALLVVALTAVEAVVKHLLERPALEHGARHVVAFDHSFPSGHALRCALVAAAFARPWGAVWAAASIVLIQLAGWHTPTDVAGGVLLGLAGLLGARALGRRRLLRGRA